MCDRPDPHAMIYRHPAQGQKLQVSGLNEITVLIDRSETALTEVAMNSWSPKLDGPPHAHDRKEQNFLVTSGRGDVVIGGERFSAAPGDFFYVPAGVVHQTINLEPEKRLEYFLFNAFLGADKEGHASFAAHIDVVKETRQLQAKMQSVQAAGGGAAATGSARRGRKATLPAAGAMGTALVARADTDKCETLAWNLPAGAQAAVAADATKEQVLFVHAGEGRVQIGGEAVNVRAQHTLLVPPGTAAALAAGPAGLQVVSFGTLVGR